MPSLHQRSSLLSKVSQEHDDFITGCYIPSEYRDSRPSNLTLWRHSHGAANFGVGIRVPRCVYGAGGSRKVSYWIIQEARIHLHGIRRWFDFRNGEAHFNVAGGFLGRNGVAGLISRNAGFRAKVEYEEVVVVCQSSVQDQKRRTHRVVVSKDYRRRHTQETDNARIKARHSIRILDI
jgi:hypothetical protein